MFGFYVYAFLMWLFLAWMGVVEIFRGMGKRFRVMLFIYLKVISNISAPEVSIITSILYCRLHWLKLQSHWLSSNIQYTAQGSPNRICCLESTGKALTAVYTLYDVDTENTIRHNIALMTSTSRVKGSLTLLGP